VGKGKLVKVTGIERAGRTATVLLRGSNKLVLEEAERSLHDALCVVRCLVHKRFLVPGGAAPEVEVGTQLARWAKTLVARARALPLFIGLGLGLNAVAVDQVQLCRRWRVLVQRWDSLWCQTSASSCMYACSSAVGVGGLHAAAAHAQGMESYCVRAFADALEVVPFTLAENAGLNPIAIVTELRNRHAQVPAPGACQLGDKD
jgi:chaperonin GroEL (HSP60 family)